MQTRLTLVVAMDARRGIGVRNTLPWRLPEDLAFFKRTTTGHTIVMGRKTFDSIGRPLPNRRNIIITRNADWRHPGAETANSLEGALRLADDEEIFVIGGAQIFAEALPLASRLIVTEIEKTFECDIFFPKMNFGEWKETGRETHYSDLNGCRYAFVTYERNSDGVAER
jgi:dihydrofolate reductase